MSLRFLLLLLVAAVLQVFAKEWQTAPLGHYDSLMGVFATSTLSAHYAMTDVAKGTGVVVTQDGGENGKFYGPAGGYNMDITITGDGKSSALAGMGGVFYGTPFSGNYTRVPIRGLSQNVESFGLSSLAAVGSFADDQKTYWGGYANGLLLSEDGGQNWRVIDIQAPDPYTYAARYGSFPTATTWFVSSGSWATSSAATATGSSSTADATGKPKSKRQVLFPHVTYDEKQGSLKFALPKGDKSGAVGSSTGYYGGISKTADGGKTWSLVYSTDQMYFNQINCLDESRCMAVGENSVNAFVMATSDGGASWAPVYTGPQYMSLAAVRMISSQEIWVGGGIMSKDSVLGYYLHSLDGGNTWTNSTLDGQVFDFSFKDGYGFASYMTPGYTGASVYK